jgi:hypothetical protein
VAFYCGVECQRSHWKVHKKECEDLYALAPGTSKEHPVLPPDDTMIYLTGASAGLTRLAARYWASSVKKNMATIKRNVAGGSMGEDTLRKTLKELRRHQAILDSPPTPQAYQEAIGQMVNALERWHCLRQALQGLCIPWMTLEEGQTYEARNREMLMEAAEAAEEASGSCGGGSGGGGGGGGVRGESAMPELTWMG